MYAQQLQEAKSIELLIETRKKEYLDSLPKCTLKFFDRLKLGEFLISKHQQVLLIGTVDTTLEAARIYNILQQHYNTNKNPTNSDNPWYTHGTSIMELRKPLERFLGSNNQTFLDWTTSKINLKKTNFAVNFTNLVVIEFSNSLKNNEESTADVLNLMESVLADSRKIIFIYPWTGETESQMQRKRFANRIFNIVAKEIFDISFSDLTKDSQHQLLNRPLFLFKDVPTTLFEFLKINDLDSLSEEMKIRLNQIVNSTTLKHILSQNFTLKEISNYFYSPQLSNSNPAFLNILKGLSLHDITTFLKDTVSTARELGKSISILINCPSHIQKKITKSLNIEDTNKVEDIIFSSEDNKSETEFMQLCKNRPENRIYWIITVKDRFFCKKIYDMNFYIQRQFSDQIILKSEIKNVFTNQCQIPDLFLFDNVTNERKLIDILGLNTKEFHKLQKSENIVVVQNGEVRFNVEKAQKIDRPVHLIKFDEKTNKCLWISSHGSLENLRHFVTVENVQIDGRELSKKMVIVLAGTAGAGKFSCLISLMRHISPTSWIFRVNLRDCRNSLKKLPSVITTDAAVEFLSSKRDNPFVLGLLADVLCNNISKPVYLLFEKFDEVLDDFEYKENEIQKPQIEKIGKLLQFLGSKTNAYIWIASERYVSVLENMLSVFSTHISDISTSDQKEFLINSWQSNVGLSCELHFNTQKQLLQEYVEQIFQATQFALVSHEVVGVPFQLHVLKEVGQPSALNEKIVCTTEWRDISFTNILKKYVRIKYDHYFDNLFKIYKKNIQGGFRTYLNSLGGLSFKQISFPSLLILEAFKDMNFKFDVSNKVFLQSIEEGQTQFRHCIFAEYFIANIISNWLLSPKYFVVELLLSEILIKPRYKRLRIFLNNLIDITTIPAAASKSFGKLIFKYWRGNATVVKESQPLIFQSIIEEYLSNIALLFFKKSLPFTEIVVSFIIARNKSGKTALFLAAEQRSEIIVNSILEYFSYGDTQHQEKLLYATLCGSPAFKDKKTTTYLLNLIKIANWQTEYSFKEMKETHKLVLQLFEEVRNNNIDSFKKLIEETGNNILCHYVFSWTDEKGLTILHLAASKGYVDIVQYLLKKNIFVDLLDQHGATPLHHASKFGHLKTIKLLQKHDSNCSISDNNKLSPLAISAKFGHFNVVESLIESGAGLKELDNNRASPLEYAARGGHLEIVKLLVKQGSDVNHQDAFGMAAISWAIKLGHLNVVEYLVSQETDLSILDCYGRSLLQIAINFEQLHIAKYLIFCGIDLNILNYNCVSSLQIAIKMNNWDIVQLLISEGAQIDVVDEDKLTPIWYVAQAKKWSLVVYMVEKGAEIADLPFTVQKDILNYALNINVAPKPPNDSFSKLYNAFYNIIRLGNIDLLKMLIELEDLNDDTKSEKLEQLLAEPYEELNLRNVPLSDKIKYFVEDKLVQLRGFMRVFIKYSSTLKKYIRKLIESTIDTIKIVQARHLETCAPKVDQEFLIYLRFIAENIQILKRYLQYSYDRIPWEEMEFCLVIFITLFLKPRDDDFPYRLVLDQTRIIMHLGHFVKTLIGIKYIRGSHKHPEPRWKNIEIISGKYPQLTSLFSDFNTIKDIYSLTRISSSIKIALSVKRTEKNEIEAYAILRCLQIIGESLKNTPESANLSEDVHDYLIYFAPKEVIKILTELRDRFSHSYTMKKRIEIENRLRNDTEFLASVQNDLNKIEVDVIDVLSRKRQDALTMFWTKIKSSNNMDDIKQLTKYIEFNAFFHYDFDNYETVENKKLESLLRELKQHSDDMADIDKSQLMKILDDMSKDRSENYSSGMLIDSLIKTENFVTLYNLATAFLNYKPRVEKNQRRANTIYNLIASILKRFSLKRSNLCHQILMILNVIIKKDKIQDIEKLQAAGKIIKEEWFGLKMIFSNKKKVIKCLKKYIKNPENKTMSIHNETKLNIFKKNWTRQNTRTTHLRGFVEQLNLTTKTKNQLLETVDRDEQELKELQLHFQQKLDILHRYLQKNVNFLKTDKVIASGVEMLALDVIDWLLMTSQLADHKTSFDDYSTVLIGRSLRNYLAHGDCLIDSLPFSPFTAALSTIQQILKNDAYSDSNQRIFKKKGLFRLNEKFKNMVSIVMTQNVIFKNLREGTLKKGDETRAIDINGNSALDFAIMSDNVELLKEFLKKEKNSMTLCFLTSAKLGSLGLINYLNADVGNSRILSKSVLIAAENGHTDVVLKLLDLGANVDMTDEFQMTPLDIAIKNGHSDIVVSLLKRKTNSVTNFNSIYFAASNGYKDVFSTLLQHKVFKNMPQETKLHVLCLAAQNGHKDVVNVLLRCNVDINTYWKGDTTALHVAVNSGHRDLVEALLDHGADINAEETFDIGGTPLHVACQNGYKTISDLLITRGANVNAKNINNVTALHVAADCAHMEIIRSLLNNGADLNARTMENRTPLFEAANNNNKEITEMLLGSGAAVNAKNKDGITALHRAASNGYEDTVISLLEHGADYEAKSIPGGWPALQMAALNGHRSVVLCLLDHGADIEAVNDTGETALFVAASHNHNDVVAELLKRGANTEAKDKEKSTALFQAAFRGFGDVVKTLLENAADVHAEKKDRSTSLDAAVQNGHKDIVKMLLKHKAEINGIRKSRSTPLQIAAQHNHTDIVDLLIDGGASVNDKFENDFTALHIAVQNRCLEVVNILLDRGADVNTEGKDKWSALHLAAQHGYDDIAATLLDRGANVNAMEVDDWSALHLAAKNGHEDVVKCLLKNDSCVNANKYNISPLYQAASYGHDKVVRYLLDHGAIVDFKERKKWTSLYSAAQNGHSKVAQILLNHGADPNFKETEGCGTALHMAASKGHLEVIWILLSHEADVNCLTKQNCTPLHCAAEKGYRDIVVALLDQNSDIEAKNNEGSAPLHIAADYGHNEVVTTLLNRGAYVNAKGKHQFTALHAAAVKGHENIVANLLARGADVDATGIYPMTPLILATMAGFKDIVRNLLDYGANVNAKGKDNLTALYYAALTGQTDIVINLVDHGADVNAANEDGQPVFYAAIGNGHKDIAIYLLGRGAKVNSADKLGRTALYLAVVKGYVDIVTSLLNYGAKMNIRAKNKWAPLHIAASRGYAHIVTILLNKGAEVNSPGDPTNNTSLHIAACNNYQELALFLIKRGANVNAVNGEKQTVLFLAARYGRQEIALSLINHGARVNAGNEDESVSALFVAAANDHTATIKCLLSKGADVNFADKLNRTALHMAVARGHLSAVLELLKHGANVHVITSRNETPLYLAVSGGFLSIMAVLLGHGATF